MSQAIRCKDAKPAESGEWIRTRTRLFKPGQNVWRTETAHRASVLIDGAAYFAAVRDAMLAAEHTIHIVGWDVDSRTPLVGESGAADDGFPVALGDFLDALALRRPHLRIRILLWDYSVFFADEREPLPSLALRWKRLPQIDLCFDATVPLGAAHHQKIVIVDDSLAFCGGLDLTIRRWDDSRHCVRNDLRQDPAGRAYPPFHDVQAMVDGPAAFVLAELVRARWMRAACETPAPPPRTMPAWPRHVVPDFVGIDVAVARTEPAFEGRPEVREVERLFIDMIACAERTIYVESQYLTLTPVAAAIAGRLRQKPALEVVILCPRSYHGMLERQAMLPGRNDFLRGLAEGGAPARWLVLAPRAHGAPDTDISLHSKVTIVDDTYMRVGSANLCHRSMATDSECDLTFAAVDAKSAGAIRRIRHRLLAEHCGCSVETLEQAIRRQGSLIPAIRAVVGRTGRARFLGIEEDGVAMPILKSIADPERPIALQRLVRPVSMWISDRRAAWAFMTATVTGFCVLTAAWALGPIGETQPATALEHWLVSPDSPPLADLGAGLGAGLAVVGIFVLAGLLAFPLLVLIVATVAVFGLWPGLAYAGFGAMASAIVSYAIGRWLGSRVLRRFFGPRLNRVSEALLARGIMAVTVIRLIPGAPYTLVNLAAGALRIHPVDYVVGTLLGLAPGFCVMALLGQQIMDVVRDPSPVGIAMLVALLLLSIGLSFGLQRIIGAWRGRKS
ncbi:VTT domain-containing protein [Dongia sp.]|uniref:VTT domain-containing protein n=1 Tax=Dongia sp. TaxID=1977262 RepID=UPI0035B3BC85